QDEDLVAFYDNNPQAPTHLLLIPKKHIATFNELEESDAELIAKLNMSAKRLAHELGIAESGYRLVLNCNAEGGQSVHHIHLHLLGGRAMQWPPG
ncbi:MAG TPA: histidine triad nucleotide-binding protein, partial [Coxiellaceae bacterium]|nr:histidine triad nucleotide-binding protein [Coxiellaceae bacterium]